MGASRRTLLSVAALSALTVVGFAAPASAYTFSDGLGGSVTVTQLGTTATIVLSDSISNPISDASALSGVQFTLSSAPSSVTGFSAEPEPLITIASDGTFSSATDPGGVTHWGSGLSGSLLTLETVGPLAAGGQPYDLIIDDLGGFSHANASITGGQFDPYIANTGTFALTMPTGYDLSTHITGTTFQYSTTAGFATGVPEPATWAMMLIGFGAVGFAMRGSRRKLLVSA